jgi:hypothetical protein
VCAGCMANTLVIAKIPIVRAKTFFIANDSRYCTG